MLQNLNLNWIRSFEAAARRQSFKEAAQELNLTQAGVSQHVRLLEQFLGEPLFTRLPRQLQLTDAGEAYLHVVKECLARLRTSTAEIFGVSNSNALVTVRCNMALASHWLALRVSSFLDAHPHISLRLLAAVHGEDSAWDGIDMELRYDSDHADGLTVHAFKADTMFPVCSPALASSLHEPRDLLRARLLHVIGNRRGWSDWFYSAGIQDFQVPAGVQADTSAIALSLCEHGVGVALGHRSLVEQALASGRLVRPFAHELEASEIFHLVLPTNRPRTASAEMFADWVLRQ
ncbi:MAG TPA: LysR substrate-binding domain-containing protein [Mesorhizobium sp.]|jgi:LysR family glycine cleavage system transcriptional activator|nr:LysR substrate-binding domain-containing protein [Mesorhizobium sp.]